MATTSGAVEAGWAWYERSQGVIAWAFRNADSAQHSVLLLRNGYYFGDAFWAVYCSNPGFQTTFLDGNAAPQPLAETGITQNTAPLGLAQFGSSDQAVACFVITLFPGQAWAMLERGYGRVGGPSGIGVYEASPLAGTDFCLGYDRRAVVEWEGQTKTGLSAYRPNPSTFNTWLFQAEGTAPHRKLFPGDSVVQGRCAPPAQEAPVVQQVEQPQQTGGYREMFPPVFPDVLSPPLNP